MDLTDIDSIKEGLASGSLVLDGSKVYSREEYEKISAAEKQVEHYDLLQLTKKIQL